MAISFPLRLYRVSGDSMAPTYRPGDLLLGRRWFRVRVGQVVVARTPERPLVKRIKAIDEAGVWLEGDNPAASTDSRQRGAFQLSDVEAVVVLRLDRA